MEHPELAENLLKKIKEIFPFPKFRPFQWEVFEFLVYVLRSIVEAPSGFGKSVIAFVLLKALSLLGFKPLYLASPTKVLVRQVKRWFPEEAVEAYGRNEYECLYYRDKREERKRKGEKSNEKEWVSAEDAPCSLLKDCPHRVDLKTGKTKKEGAEPCPYLLAKYLALKGKVVLCTHSFFAAIAHFTEQFKKNPPYAVVIDEAHRFADSVRNLLTYEISDYNVRRAVKALSKIGWEYAEDLAEFLKLMVKIARLKPKDPPELLSDYEIKKLLGVLGSVAEKSEKIEWATGIAIKKGILDPVKDRQVLKTLEVIIRDIKWWMQELRYALPEKMKIWIEGEEKEIIRKPENYVYMYFRKEKTKRQKVRCKLVIRHFFVSPLIRARILSLPRRVHALSATIIKKEQFAIETGMDYEFKQVPSIFPIENTRIYLPTDTPNLARKCQKPGDLERAMEMIALACKEFLKEGFRSLVVMPAERERDMFVRMFSKDFKIMTYGEKIKAKEAAELFKEGEGDVLVGTLAHYAEGLDLPRNIAPVIFNLRPDYPKPRSPQAQFEVKRWGKERWPIWNWRVSRTALQVRGRNQRTAEDIGLCFFISQQFRRCLKLPEWLKPAVVRDKTFWECVEDGISLLKKKVKKDLT